MCVDGGQVGYVTLVLTDINHCSTRHLVKLEVLTLNIAIIYPEMHYRCRSINV